MTKIIAEIGSNYKSTDDIFRAVSIAKSLKLDIFKIQWFSEFDLYGSGSTKRQFDLDTIKKLREECDKHKIKFMCTAFDPEAYKLIDPFVHYHKIACSERNHKEIGEIATSFGKLCFVSYLPSQGRYLQSEIWDDTASLMCVPEYPCHRLPLEYLKYFDGVSDHTKTIDQTITAMKFDNCAFLEKHWNPFNYADTPDACCSINNDQMKELSDSRFTTETWTNKYERKESGYRPRL